MRLNRLNKRVTTLPRQLSLVSGRPSWSLRRETHNVAPAGGVAAALVSSSTNLLARGVVREVTERSVSRTATQQRC